ncbi:hypothetical protein EHP00_102 [Ecytonucleospora hepatopenaei]|uniref:J domain-containing protein n=1 Tax=Ecytonucleospora hepatopenaei TaxID=646526 RepID=A0A1W0E5Q2_9MICR|nr:hypothetical protein EHP00_102 [Ecytonucleospora hepatopenaei]
MLLNKISNKIKNLESLKLEKNTQEKLEINKKIKTYCEIKRILDTDDTIPFDVLNIDKKTCKFIDVKENFINLAKVIHPNNCKCIGSREAAVKLQNAYLKINTLKKFEEYKKGKSTNMFTKNYVNKLTNLVNNQEINNVLFNNMFTHNNDIVFEQHLNTGHFSVSFNSLGILSNLFSTLPHGNNRRDTSLKNMLRRIFCFIVAILILLQFL